MDLIKTLNNFFSKDPQITPSDLIEFCKQDLSTDWDKIETTEEVTLFI